MPIYEYECQKCGHTLEALQKFSDKPLRECPECGKHQLKRKERKRNILEKGDKEPPPPSDDKAPKPPKAAKAPAAGSEKARAPAAKPARAARPKTTAKKAGAARAKKR